MVVLSPVEELFIIIKMDYDEIIRSFLQNGKSLSDAKAEIAKTEGAQVAEEAVNSYLGFSVNQIHPYINQLIEQGYNIHQIKEFLASKGYLQEIIDRAFSRYYQENFSEYVGRLSSQGQDKKTLRNSLIEKGFEEKEINKYLSGNSISAKPIIIAISIIALVSLIFFVLSTSSIDSLPVNVFQRSSSISMTANSLQSNVASGENFEFEILTSGNIVGAVDVSYRYEILSVDGIFITSATRSRVIRELGRTTDRIQIPQNVPTGSYYLNIISESSAGSSRERISFAVTQTQDSTQEQTSPEGTPEQDSPIDDSSTTPTTPGFTRYEDLPAFLVREVQPLQGEEEGTVTVQTTQGGSISAYRTQQEFIDAVSDMEPAFAFYLCGKMPMDGTRERCFSKIDLTYESLGETEYCEDVLSYRDQVVCVPKVRDEVSSMCDYIFDDDAREDCMSLSQEYAGTLEIMLELFDSEETEMVDGERRRIVTPWSFDLDVVSDYE